MDGRGRGGSSLIKTEWQQELVGVMGSEKWKMKRDAMRGCCWSHMTSVTRSSLSLSKEVSLALTYIKRYRHGLHKPYRGPVLKFLTSVLKLLCEITKELERGSPER